MRLLLILIFSGVCISACKRKDAIPDGILKKEQMQAVLWDIFRAESYTNSFIKKDTLKNPIVENAKIQQQVFVIHHISREVFDKSYNYYKEHPELMQVILDSMASKATMKRNRLFKAKIKADSTLDD